MDLYIFRNKKELIEISSFSYNFNQFLKSNTRATYLITFKNYFLKSVFHPLIL